MKRTKSFWLDLESYTWKIVSRVSPALPWFTIVLVVLVVGASIVANRESLASARSLREASLIAARAGDYIKATELYERSNSMSGPERVQGVETEEELIVYPERRIEQEIEKYEELLRKYPGHRDALITLGMLCNASTKIKCREDYWGQAMILDPNNPIFEQK